MSNEVQEEKDLLLQDMDVSNMILINNPNNEIAIGYCTESKAQSESICSAISMKQVTHQHYGTIQLESRNNRLYYISRQDFVELRIHSLLIKYVVLLLSLVLISLDAKNIKNRIDSQEDIIAELRTIHIQMDDLQLYQIFWSFLIVYIASLSLYCMFVMVSIIYDSPRIIKYTFRLLMFGMLYQFIEIILRRYDFLLMFLRIILILLIKIWININTNVQLTLLVHPEYANPINLNNN